MLNAELARSTDRASNKRQSAFSISPYEHIGHNRQRFTSTEHVQRGGERLQWARVANSEQHAERTQPIRGAKRVLHEVVERLPSRIHPDLHFGIRRNLRALLRDGQRAFQPAQLVNQANLFSLSARPHPSL